MPAHRRELEDCGVRQAVDPAAKAQGVLDAVTGDSVLAAATLRLVDGRAYVNRNAELGPAHGVDKSFHVLIIVKDRRHRGVPLDTRDHLLDRKSTRLNSSHER